MQFVPAAVADGSIIARFNVVDSMFDRHLNFIARAYAPVAAVHESSPSATLAIYPNPATTELHIDASLKVQIIDALGRAYRVLIHDGTVDISSLPKGVYYLNGGNERAKFVKQ